MEKNTAIEINKIWCEEVIINTTKRRGTGTKGDPIRIITEVFLKDGTKIAEMDSFYDGELFDD